VSRREREKGKRGEREVAAKLCAFGFDARRDGRLDDDLAHDVAGVHFEVKRCETLKIPQWSRAAADAAGPDRTPIVVFRRSGESWKAVVEFDYLLELLAERRQRG